MISPRAAHVGQGLGGIRRRAVDVIGSAELAGERFLVRPAIDRDRAKALLRRELDGEMAEAADAVHRHDVAGARAGVAGWR